MKMSIQSYMARLKVTELRNLEMKRIQIIEETTDKELLELKLKEIDAEIAKVEEKYNSKK